MQSSAMSSAPIRHILADAGGDMRRWKGPLVRLEPDLLRELAPGRHLLLHEGGELVRGVADRQRALAREAIAGSELLAEGLAAARQEITVVRAKMFEWREAVVFWMYIAATANTLVWLWGGLGQLCLIGWGRRRFAGWLSSEIDHRPEAAD